MNRKHIIMILFCFAFAAGLFVLYSITVEAKEESDKTKTGVEVRKEDVSTDEKETTKGKPLFAYKLSKWQTLRYSVTHNRKDWDEEGNLLRDYSTKGVLSITVEKVDEDGSYVLNAESLVKWFSKDGKEFTPDKDNRFEMKMFLNAEGGIIFENREPDNSLKRMESLELIAPHISVLKGAVVAFPVLPPLDAAVEGGVFKWKGRCLDEKKPESQTLERYPEWKLIYEGKKKNDMLMIKGHSRIRTVESQFTDGFVMSGRTYYDYKSNDKIVLHSEVIISMIEE